MTPEASLNVQHLDVQALFSEGNAELCGAELNEL